MPPVAKSGISEIARAASISTLTKGYAMTTKSLFAAPLFAVVAAFAATPATAEQPMTVSGERIYQERVSFNDLDLTKAPHQRELRLRVRTASDRVCVAALGTFAALERVPFGRWNAGMACSDLTYDEARPQIRSAIQQAKSGQLAGSSITILAMAK